MNFRSFSPSSCRTGTRAHEPGLNKRFDDFGSSMRFDIGGQKCPVWTREHVQILHEIFGKNNLEPRIVPTPDDLHDLNFEYLKIMYPEAEISSDGERLKAETNAYDRANGLVFLLIHS